MSRSLDAARGFLEQLEAQRGREEAVLAREFSVSGRMWTVWRRASAPPPEQSGHLSSCVTCRLCLFLSVSWRIFPPRGLLFSSPRTSVAHSRCLGLHHCLQVLRAKSKAGWEGRYARVPASSSRSPGRNRTGALGRTAAHLRCASPRPGRFWRPGSPCEPKEEGGGEQQFGNPCPYLSGL
jgi:hypothetical protein